MSYPPNRNRINFETSWENVGASQSGPADRSAEADRQSPKRVPAPRSPSGAGPGENDSPRRVSPQSQHSSPVGHANNANTNADGNANANDDDNDESKARGIETDEQQHHQQQEQQQEQQQQQQQQQQRRPPPPPPPQRRHPTVETDRPLGTQQRPLMPGPKPRSQPHQQSHALNPLYPPGTPPSRHRDRTHDDDKNNHRLNDDKDDFRDTHGRGGGSDGDVTPPRQTTGVSGGTPRGDGSSATPRGRPPVPPSPRQPPSLVDTPRSHSVPEQPRSRPQSRADSRRDSCQNSRHGSDSNSNTAVGGGDGRGDGLPRVPEQREREVDDDRGHSSGQQPGRQEQQDQQDQQDHQEQQQQRGALVGSSSRGVSPKVPSRRPPSTSRGGSNPPPRTPRLRPSITSESPIRPPLPTHTAALNDSSHGDEHASNSHGEDRGDGGGDGRGVSPHGSNVGGQEDSGAAPQPSWTDVYGGIPGRRASEFEKVNPLERKDTPEPDTRNDGSRGQNRRQHDDDEDEEATLGMLGEPLREDDDNDVNDGGHGRDTATKNDDNTDTTTDQKNKAVAANDDRSASTDHANEPSQFTFPTDEPAAADDRDANVNDNDKDHDHDNARRPQSENSDYGNGSSTSGRRDDGADNDVVAEPHSSTPAAAAINPQTMDGSQQDHDADARSENSKNADDRAAPYNGDDDHRERSGDHPRGQQQEQRTSADDFNRQESAPTPPAVLDDASSTRMSPTRPYENNEHNDVDDDNCVSPESPEQGRHTSGPTDSSDTDARRPDDRHDRPDGDNDRRGAADSYGNDTTADRRGGDVDRGGHQNEAAPLPRTVSNQSAHSRTSRAVSDRGSRRGDGRSDSPAARHASANTAPAAAPGHDQSAEGDDRGVSPMANYLPPGAMGRGVPPAATTGGDSRRGSQASGRGNTRTTADRDQRAGGHAVNDRNRRNGGSRGASASASALASRSSSTVTASVIVDVESASNVSAAAAAVTPTRIAPIGDLGRSISAAISDSGGRNQRSTSGRQDAGRQELPRSTSSNDNRAVTVSASHDVSPIPRDESRNEYRNESRSMSKQSADMYGSSPAAAATAMARRATAGDKKDSATTVAVEFVLSGLVLGDLWETSKRQQQDLRAAVKTEIWHLIADHGVAVDQISTDFSDSRIARDGIGIVGADVTPEKSLAEARSAERDRSAHINSQSSPSGSHKASTFEGYRSRPDLYPTDEHGSISPSKFQTAGDSSSVRRTMHGDVSPSPSKTHHLQSEGEGEGDDGRVGVDLHEDPANAPKFSGVIVGISSRTKRAVIKDTLSCYLGSARAFTGTIACVASVTGILEQAIDIKPKTRRIDGLLIPDRSTGSVSFPEPDSMQAYERRRRLMQGLPDVPGISAPAATSQQVSGARASASAHHPISSTSMPHALRQDFNDSSYRTVQSVRDGDPQSHHSSHHNVGGATHFVDGRTNQPSALHLNRNGSHVDPHRSQTTPMESHPRNSNRYDQNGFVDADHDNDRTAAGDVSRAVLEEGAPYHGTTRLAGLSRENEDIVLRGMNHHHQSSTRADDPSATAGGDGRGAGRGAQEQQVLTGLSAHRLARPRAGNSTAPAHEHNRHPDDFVDRGGLDRGASVNTSTTREGSSEGISKRDFYDAAMPITERQKSSKRPGAPPPRATVHDLVPPMPNPATAPISVSKPVVLTREEFLYGDHGAETSGATTSSAAERRQLAADQGAPPVPVEYSSLHPAHPENARSPVIPSSTAHGAPSAPTGRQVDGGHYDATYERGFGVEDLHAARDPLSKIGGATTHPDSRVNSRLSGVSGARAAAVPVSVPRSLVESFSGPSGPGDTKSGSHVSGKQRPAAAAASSRGVSQSTVGGAPPPHERATSHVVGSRSASHVSGQNHQQQYQHLPPQQSNRGGDSVNMQPQTPSRRLSGAMSSAAATTAPSHDGDRTAATTTAGNSRSTSRQQQQQQTQSLAVHQQSRRLKTPEVPIEDRLGSSAAIGAVPASNNNRHEESVRRYGGRGAFKTPTDEDSMRGGGGDGSRRMSDREGLVRSPERQPEESSFYVYRTKDVPLQQHAQRKATQHYQW